MKTIPSVLYAVEFPVFNIAHTVSIWHNCSVLVRSTYLHYVGPGFLVFSQPLKLTQLGHPFMLGKLSKEADHEALSVVLQCKLVSG